MQNNPNPSYDELKRQLAEAQGVLKALRSGQIDSVTTEAGTIVLRLAESEAQAQHIKKVLQAIRKVNQLIAAEENPFRLAEQACIHLSETMGYLSAWVALLNQKSDAAVFTAASGFGSDFAPLAERIKAGHFTNCMKSALAADNVVIVKILQTDCHDCPLADKYGNRAAMISSLRHGDRNYGVLSVSVPIAYASDEEEQTLFGEVARDMAYALHKIETARILRESQQDLKRAQAMAQFGFWRFNLNTGSVIASEEARRIYGLTDTESSIALVKTIPLPEYRQTLDEAMEKLIRLGEPYNVEFQIQRPSDLSIRHIHSIAEYDREQNVVIGTIHDITAQKLIAAAVKSREHFLHAILQTTADGFLVLDTRGAVVEANNAYCKMSGYSRDEILGLGINDLDANENFAETQARIQKIIRNGSELFETKHRRKNATLWPVEVSVSWVGENGGRFVCFFRDLSERKQREERIVLLGQMLDAAPASITIHNTQGKFLFANRATAAIHGYENEADFSNVNLCNLDVPESADLVAERIRKITEDGEARFEVAHFRKDGSTFPLEVIAKSIEWNGEAAILSIASDITERKRAEEELTQRKNQLQKIFEILPIGLWLADKDGNLVSGNAMGVKIWGAEPHVPISEYGIFKAWRLPSREPVKPEEWALARTFREHVTIVDELLEIEAFDGKKRTILNYSAPVLDDKGNIACAIVVNLDISDRMALEDQLRQSQKMESVGRLAGGIAHDFNNMLGVIIGNVELAQLKLAPDSELNGFLNQIARAAERSASITSQLLAYARKQPIAPRVIDLNDAIAGMLKMLRTLIGEEIALTWIPGLNLDTVSIDPSQLDQILANLCINSRDAITGTGRITVETKMVTFDEYYCETNPEFSPGRFVMMAISDDGCGMDQYVLNNLFEPFFTTKGVGQGSGLGLATVYGIVKQNRGFVRVQSAPGKGATFDIYLPAHYEAAEAEPATAAVSHKLAAGTETILLVEDELAILNVTNKILGQLGYTVLPANSPGEAIELAIQHAGAIDLLISDVVMPEMNGKLLAEQIVSLYPGIRLLFMSGHTAEVIARRGVLDEEMNFIQKPFSRKDLAEKVRKVLDNAA